LSDFVGATSLEDSFVADHQLLNRPTAADFADYAFSGGFPTTDTIRRAYDDTDLIRAIEAYKFFFPTVSMAAIWKGNLHAGLKPNAGSLLMMGSPRQMVLTPNSDTPYTGTALDLSDGPVVIELPPGPLMGVVNDLNQRYVMDLGLAGPDAGKGGKHVVLPPNHGGVPKGYYAGTSSTNRAMLSLRALPVHGDNRSAIDLLKQPTIHRYDATTAPSAAAWIEIGSRYQQFTAFDWERTLAFWNELHEIVELEPVYEPYRMNYGQLAALGIEKGKTFSPDERMRDILVRAAGMANAQMRVQSFADRRTDRIAWPDRRWEWAGLRPERGIWDLPSHRDLAAREKWFFQAAIESPAMFRRDPGAGSLYWLGTRDHGGAYLNGSQYYRLTVPLPVPGKLFWSLTLYDPDTRSEIVTPQGQAALRSLFELKDVTGARVDLYFGPEAVAGQDGRWIQTLPNKGWFAYFRIYGPEHPAFDGSWRPGDFELLD
jgi:hypothetical protein